MSKISVVIKPPKPKTPLRVGPEVVYYADRYILSSVGTVSKLKENLGNSNLYSKYMFVKRSDCVEPNLREYLRDDPHRNVG